MTEDRFTKMNASRAMIITFAAENREDVIEMILDEKQRFTWSISHMPKGAEHWKHREEVLELASYRKE
jgi:hypothetical protein